MKRQPMSKKVLITWIILGVAVCCGLQFGPEEEHHTDTLINTSQPASEEIYLSSTRFQNSHPEPKVTLHDYLNEISTSRNDKDKLKKQLNDGENGKVVVVTRAGQDSTGEWMVVAEPRIDENSTDSESQEKELDYSFDYLLETEDVQKYVDDYENILFSFKDLVKIGTNPNVKEKVEENKSLGQEIGEKFNVTYVMPIPNKNERYFKIVIPNLTETQYHEINTLLQEHMQNNTQATDEAEVVAYVDDSSDKKHLTSRSLTDSSMSLLSFQEQKSPMILPSNLTDALAFFQKELTEKGYSPLLHSLSPDLPKHYMNRTENHPGDELDATFVVKSNGFSIPVATDYKHDDQKQSNSKLSLDTNYGDTPNINRNAQVVTLSNPVYTQRSITNHRQRPQMNSTRNRIKMRTNSTPQTITKTNISQEPPIKNESIFKTLNVYKTKESLPETVTNEPSKNTPQIEDILMERNVTTLQMNFDSPMSGVLQNEMTQDPGNVNIMQAANFILDMKKKLEDEERKKNERYKSYIKSFLRGENSILPMKSENGSVMKINRQDDILEELKLLMLDYFTFMQFNLFESLDTNSSLAIESILNATDLFELMERSSKLVKLNLQFKMQNESKEPTGFVKRVVESQVEKCRELTTRLREKGSDTTKEQSHKTYMIFTRCMNLKLTKCLKGFSIWLKRGKFYRRPQFNLRRAYENYELEKNLYCIRTYNALTSESSPRGMKVRPGLKVNRKTGVRRRTKGSHETSLGIRNEQNIRERGQNSSSNKRLKNRQAAHKISNSTRALKRNGQGPRLQRFSTNQSSTV